MAIIKTSEVVTPNYFLYEDANGINYLFLDYLRKTFGKNNPIFLDDITYSEVTQDQILNGLNKLCENGKLARFYNEDVWYIPTITCTGKISILNPEIIINRKYISNNTDIYGFYGGLAIQNYLGLSTQIAVTPTIYTNKWTSNEEKKVEVGWCDVVLKKPITPITSENVFTLTFLELLTKAPAWWFRDKDEGKLQRLGLYIKENQITKQSFNLYLPLFPDETSKRLKESGLIYYAAQ